MYEVGYVVLDGAALFALWHFAVQAALGFFNGLAHGVHFVYLVKIGQVVCVLFVHQFVFT